VKLLLDTHIWLWGALDPTRLSRRVRSALEDPQNEVWLSSLGSGCGDRRHVVAVEYSIGRENRQILQLRLSDKQAIERIPVMGRQRSDMQDVAVLDWQRQCPRHI